MSRLHAAGALVASALFLMPAPSLATEALTPPPSDDVTLEAVLAHALEHAPRLLVARGRAAFQDAERAQAGPFFPENPELSVAAGPRITTGVLFDVEASLSQRIEVAGEPFLRREAAERRAGVLEAQLRAERWEVHRAVHAAFFGALVAKERARALADAEGFARELVDIAAARARAGDISPLQEALARTEHARARQAHQTAEQEYLAARLVLAEGAGWPVARPPVPTGELRAPKSSQTHARLVELAMERQAQLLAKSAAVLAAQAGVASAERASWPKPQVGVAYALEGGGFSPLSGDHIVLGTLGVPLPLWQRNQGERARAKAELGLAEAELQAARIELPARLARTQARVDAAALRVEAYERDIVPSVENSLSLLRKAFELGEVDVTEVMLGRERLLAARRELLDAYEEYFRALGDLESEIGAETIDVPAPAPASGGAP